MGRSIRSQRGKALRRIKRDKLEHWDKNRIQKLSNALAKSKEHAKYISDDGSEKTLSDEQQQELVKKLDTVAMDLSDDQTVAEPETEKEPEKELTLNQIIRKTGIPKRKKRCTGRYSGTKGKKKKKSKK
mmetsp:Transcript_3686/g.4553  ORF Transcript_3686/g.4553 Transcript_3686/m.4553 type:complete len:129 (+) Transcript_3686:76-462(+)